MVYNPFVDGPYSQIVGALRPGIPMRSQDLSGAARVQPMVVQINGGGTLADNTVYKNNVAIGRVGKLTKATAMCGTLPIGGVNAVKVTNMKTGNTALAANADPTTFTANRAKDLPLTATAADLVNDADTVFQVEWDTGNPQTTDAQQCSVVLEFSLSDFVGP